MYWVAGGAAFLILITCCYYFYRRYYYEEDIGYDEEKPDTEYAGTENHTIQTERTDRDNRPLNKN